MPTSPTLPRFLLLYGAMFSAFGVASPFLPGLMEQHGLSPGTLAVVLAAGTAVRLLSGPFGGRLADRAGRPSAVLAGFAAASAIVACGYAPARGLLPLLLVSVVHAGVLAPLTPISDALALGSADGKKGFEYGWVRGAGSAAFIGGTLASAWFANWAGLGVIVWLNAGLLAATALAALLVPNTVSGTRVTRLPADKVSPWVLLRLPLFGRMMIVASLIGASHALHDGFGVIRWRAAGLTDGQSGLLWSMSVGGEVLVFFLLGRRLLERIGPANALTLSAIAGVIRWCVAARTAWFPAMALTEPLHGFTFALLHLACMDMIARVVPVQLAATAQAFYGTIALGVGGAAMTLASGPLYDFFGAGAFWAMAALCAAALPLARTLGTLPPAPASTA